jgi:ElaB/YqjD/DUF883 family membrane-anchored ribosome-binding protein
MRLLRTAQRSQDDIANDFAELIEEGRALLGEMVGKPVKTATRDTMDQMSGKVADLQDYALAAAREGMARGAKYGKQAGRLVRENPWPTLAGGVALGVIAMLLWKRR